MRAEEADSRRSFWGGHPQPQNWPAPEIAASAIIGKWLSQDATITTAGNRAFLNAMGCMSVAPKNPYAEILTPKVILLGGRAFGSCLGLKDGGLMNEVSALIKEVPERSLAFFCHVGLQ